MPPREDMWVRRTQMFSRNGRENGREGKNEKNDKVMLQWCEQPKFDIVFNTMHQGMRNQDDNVLSM